MYVGCLSFFLSFFLIIRTKKENEIGVVNVNTHIRHWIRLTRVVKSQGKQMKKQFFLFLYPFNLKSKIFAQGGVLELFLRNAKLLLCFHSKQMHKFSLFILLKMIIIAQNNKFQN